MSFAVIFDMDGVLVNSIDPIIKTDMAILAEYGVKVSARELQPFIGVALADFVPLMNKKYGLNMKQEDFRKKSIAMQSQLMQHEKPDEELLSLLKELKSNRIKLAVGTGSTSSRTHLLLDILGIKHYFSSIVAYEDVPNTKPAPDTYLKAAENLNMPIERCIVFEDSDTGVTAAKRAGMKVIAILHSYNSREQLKDADMIIESFEGVSYQDIKDMLDNS